MTFQICPLIFTILTPLQYIKIVVGSIVMRPDPDSLFLVNADTDTAFFQCSYGSGSGSRALMTKNWKTFTAEKINYIYLLIKNCNLLIRRTSIKDIQATEKSASLKREHPALQSLKISSLFRGSFLPSWIRIRIQIHNTGCGGETGWGWGGGGVAVQPSRRGLACGLKEDLNTRNVNLKMHFSPGEIYLLSEYLEQERGS